MPHAEFQITVPKFDNDGHRISTEVLKNIALEMSKQFGGVTIIPKIIGCYTSDVDKDEKGEPALQCEENAVFKSYRINGDSTLLEKDREFTTAMASRIGALLGQESILSTEDDTTRITWNVGMKKREVPATLRDTNAFSQLVD